MRKLEGNNLSVDKNRIVFTFKYLSAKIVPIQAEENILFYLKVFDSVTRKDFRLYFATLEGAVDFVTNTVSKSMSLDTVIQRYNESTVASETDHQMCLKEADIFCAINACFCNNKSNYKVTPHKELLIENGQPRVLFYLLEETTFAGRIYRNKVYLTDSNLKHAINSTYLRNSGHEVAELQYVGGVHHVGYYYDEDTPYFEGFKVCTKDIENVKGYPLSMTQKNEK